MADREATAEVEELLAEVAASGVSFEDPRVGYVEVQIDRETWDQLRAFRAALSAPEGEPVWRGLRDPEQPDLPCLNCGHPYYEHEPREGPACPPVEQQPDQVETVALSFCNDREFNKDGHAPEDCPALPGYRKMAARAIAAYEGSRSGSVGEDLKPARSETSLKGMSERRPWKRCSACRGVCHWHDEAWVCKRCGSEWYPDHGPNWQAPSVGEDQRLTPEHLDALSSAALFLDTALTMLVERELFIEGVTEKPVPVVGTNAWFGGAKDLVVTLRALASGEGAEDG